MPIYTLGPLHLDTQHNLLLREGAPVPLGRRAIALLRTLVERPGALVSKDALMEAAWSGRVVEESNLPVQIAALRRVLGEAPGGDRWIETMPGRGYRFIGPIVAEMEQDAMAAPPQVDTVWEPTPTPRADAERRQITAMSCELIGISGRADGVGLEDLRDVAAAFQRCVSETVDRHDGFVVSRLGNAALVLFGYPAAHEYDAERAVRAGLALCETVRTLRSDADLPMRCRVGIATGMAIIGDLSGDGALQHREVIGDAPNLAGRLQLSIQPDIVAIGPATRRLIGNLFDCRDLGAIDTTRGIKPLHIWQVLEDSATANRFEALRGLLLSPLVGRDEELGLLLRRWQQAKTGEGRVVLVSGEPGIGKSRLAAALLQRIENDQHTRLRYFCSPYHQDSVLYPFIVQLERAAGFARQDGVDQKLAKFRGLLAPAARSDDEIALLAELLSLPNSAADLTLSPQRKREKLFDALVHQFETLAGRRPVLMVFEDAQWIDPTSRELLDLTLDRVAGMHVLLILTFRPEFEHSWSGQPHVTLLGLNRLGVRDGAALVEGLAGVAGLPRDIVNEIVERTDGVPLFLEELTKAVLESDGHETQVAALLAANPLPNLTIPAALHASLLARLDRLGPLAKEIAQIGAVLGREFSYDLIERVAQRPAADLQAALGRLAAAGLLFCRGVAPQSAYLFKHALVQDTAYSTLLRASRQQLHARVATALEHHFADIVERQPELVAHHYSEAGQPARAITYWQAAGENAVRRSANQEAIGHLTAGLAQLGLLLETQDRARQELVLQRLLGQASFATRGYASPEASRAFNRARELCAEIGDDSGIFPVLAGVFLFQMTASHHRDSMITANETIARAGRTQNTGARLVGNLLVGLGQLHLAALATARAHFDQAIKYYRSLSATEAERLPHEYGADPAAATFAYASWCLWLLGYPDQASRLGDEGLAILARSGHGFTHSRGLYWNSVLHACRREWPIAEERGAVAIASAQERDLAMVVAVGRIMQGAARAMLDPRDEHLAEIRGALAAYRATGARLQMTYHLVLLAQALADCDRHGEGLSALREAAVLTEETSERFAEAEIHRVEGNLLLTENGLAGAEACYVRALEVARAQEARSLELRAASDLARLWAGQGRRAEALDVLAPVYGWFTEGFDTADLKEAKALLDELKRAVSRARPRI